VQSETGSLTLKHGEIYYSLYFAQNGWLAGDLVQYVDEIILSPQPETAILKLLGYTMQMSRSAPRREADHWIELDLEKRELSTNSDLIRLAVDEDYRDLPYNPAVLRRVHDVLDRFDFTVRLIRK
jgi:hypothetical protein